MQTNSIKAIKDYLKFYFASQEFVYLPPQKILAKTPNDNIAQDTAKNTSLKKSPSEFQPRQTAVATQNKTAKNTSLKKSPSEFQPRQTAVATQRVVSLLVFSNARNPKSQLLLN